MKRNNINTLGIIAFLLVTISCRTEKRTYTAEKLNDTIIDSQLVFGADTNSVNYFFPSPNEILEEVIVKKVAYNPDIPNPEENKIKYLERKQQALNLGVYLSDLAYTNLYGDKKLSLQYFSTIKDLSQKLSIYQNLDNDLFERGQRNITHRDSLNIVLQELYGDIRYTLETSKRNNLYALITSGAIIEALYLSTYSVKDFNEYKAIAIKVFEQRYLVQNFYAFASNYKKDPNVQETMEIFESFNALMAGAEKTTDKLEMHKDSKDHFTMKGGEDVNVTEMEFEKFKELVSIKRQELTGTLD